MTEAEKKTEQDETVIAYLKAHPDGVMQSDLWKDVNIDSRTCSRIVKRLEDAGLIQREEIRGKTHTFLVKYTKPRKEFNPLLLIAGESILPCVACDEECDVPNCKMLEDWIYELVFSEIE
ncbi:MAG: MarR family transcriptional regulator [Methanocorpusculum sp.]|nr:MarR family transcriptional regulator [Methanocorpusculum sp.]